MFIEFIETFFNFVGLTTVDYVRDCVIYKRFAAKVLGIKHKGFASLDGQFSVSLTLYLYRV